MKNKQSITDIINTLEFQFPEMEVHRVDRAVSLPGSRQNKTGWNIVLMYREPTPEEQAEENRVSAGLIGSMIDMAAAIGARTVSDPLLESPLLDNDQKALVREVLGEAMKQMRESVEKIKKQAAGDDATRQ